MPQAYAPVPSTDDAGLRAASDTSSHHDPDSEKYEWTTRPQRGLQRRIPGAHWTWYLQAAMLSASVTLFIVSMCRMSGGAKDAVPTSWCKYSSQMRRSGKDGFKEGRVVAC